MRFAILFSLLLSALNQTYAQQLPALIPYTTGDRWGYADTQGRVVIQPQWRSAGFFKDGKARVLLTEHPAERTFALIDIKGAYIIPPDRHWNGKLGGWAINELNVSDSNGKFGVVDTNNNVVVGLEWDAPVQYLPASIDASYKIVRKNDLFGIIDGRNELIVPCRFAAIDTDVKLFPIKALLTRDADNAGGQNRVGLMTKDGRIVLPARYSSIELVIRNRDTFLHVQQAVDNEHVNDYGYSGSAAGVITKWFRYEIDRPAVMLHAQPIAGDSLDAIRNPVPFERKGGFILYGNRGGYGLRGLMDTNRKVLIPCCTVVDIIGDTVLTYEEKNNERDTLTVVTKYLDKNSLKPLVPEKRIYFHYKPYVYGSRNNEYEEVQLAKSILYEGRNIYQFYKDSFLYTIAEKMPGLSRYLYLVKGTAKSRYYNNYTAVVDSNLNYVIPPTEKQIVYYNEKDDIVTITGYDKIKDQAGFGFYTLKGEELMMLQCNQMYNGVRWKGIVYGLAAWEKPVPPRAQGEYDNFYNGNRGNYSHYRVELYKLTDNTGALMPATKNYYFFWKHGDPRLIGRPAEAMTATDTTARISYIYPDGKPVYPALHFVYNNMQYKGNSWFYGTTAKNLKYLVDTNNKNVLKGGDIIEVNNVRYLSKENIGSGGMVIDNFNSNNDLSEAWASGLWLVQVYNTQTKKHFSCLVDHKKRMYCSDELTKQKK